MAHGNIYAPEKVDAALGNYFRVGNLTALRELALLWVADKVDESLQDYMDDHGIEGSWETRERVVVAVTGAPSGEHLIRRAARMATRAKGELLGVHVRAGDGLADAPPELLDPTGSCSRTSAAPTTRSWAPTSPARSPRSPGRAGHPDRARGVSSQPLGRGDPGLGHQRGHAAGSLVRRARHRRGVERTVALSARRRAAGWLVTVLGTPLLTAALVPVRDDVGLSTSLMAYLMLVVLAAAVGGVGPGLTAAAAGSLALNWYFTEPLHQLTIADRENVAALLGFVVVGGVVAFLVTQAARRTLASRRAAAEAEALARVAAGLLGDDDPLPSLVDRLRSTFALDRVAVEELDEATGEWTETAGSGVLPPAASPAADGLVAPASGLRTETLEINGHARLVLHGPAMTAEDQRVLHAFVAQLATALRQRQLRAEAASAIVSAESDALRTALLRSVSHDLRTPLASIKASVSSLLQRDVAWPPEATDEFLRTIDHETDRLNTLVGNLLDMSRLEAGVLEARPVAVGWDEVVAAALSSLSERTDRVEVSVPESLPPILADPVLLERSVANLVANALHHTPADRSIRIVAGTVADRVDLRVIDTGPGVPPARREQLFRPFQRLDDHSPDGVGLGLAVSRGFVEALGGDLEAEETPGGGLTMVIRMPAA
jgi:two-component system sensor histidine kinase KdpD